MAFAKISRAAIACYFLIYVTLLVPAHLVGETDNVHSDVALEQGCDEHCTEHHHHHSGLCVVCHFSGDLPTLTIAGWTDETTGPACLPDPSDETQRVVVAHHSTASRAPPVAC
jgi:hypothetical protein